MSGKILIVDDSPSTRMLMKFSLQKQGFFVFEASDGESALEVLSKNTEIKILVTDINMPVMDGIELIKRVRDLTDYRYVPIVVFTNPNSPESKKKARDAGATGWIDKPFKPNVLIKIIKKFEKR